MRALVGLLLLGLVVVVRAQGPAGWASLIAARSTVNEVRMQTLRQRLSGLADRLKGVGDGIATDTLALGLRVRSLTGNGCGEKQFQCGGDAPQCVSAFLACDGSTDCRNGNDESTTTCTNPYDAGSVFSGRTRFKACAFKGPAGIRVLVTSSNDKPGRSELTATVVVQMMDGTIISENTSGNYWYGTEMVQIEPTPSNRIGIRCAYNRATGDCSGQVVNNGGFTCGDIVLQ